jgi:outer membrane protein, heavy metal efflux system
MDARCVGLVVGLFAAQANATPLTAEDVVRRALMRPALADLIEGEVGVARAEAVRAGLWPNPTATYSREQTFFGAISTIEDYAWLTQRVEISGQRRLRRKAGNRATDAATFAGAARRVEVAADARRRFYAVVAFERKLGAARGWASGMDSVLGTVAKREQRGDASRYDRRRLERERASAQAQLQTIGASLVRARARLAALVGDPAVADSTTIGSLLPTSPLPDLAQLIDRLRLRPQLRALDEDMEAALLERRAAGRGWVPDLTLSGGLKTLETGGGPHTTGFLATVTVPIPVFDRGQDAVMRADGRLRIARSTRTLLSMELEGEIRGLSAEAAQLIEAARSFRETAVNPSAELVRTAEAAYAGGEFGILELLDAYRAAFQAETDAVDLETRARLALIDLDRIVGDLP